jgi:hypothetical protein
MIYCMEGQETKRCDEATVLPMVFLFSGKTGYLMTHFATDVLIQWQNEVSFDSFCH